MATETKAANGKTGRYVAIGAPDADGMRDMTVVQIERSGPEGAKVETKRNVTYKGFGEGKGAGTLWLAYLNKVAKAPAPAGGPDVIDGHYTMWLNSQDLKARQGAKEGAADPIVAYGTDGRRLNLVTGVVTLKDGKPDPAIKTLALDQRVAIINGSVSNAKMLGALPPKAFATASAELVKSGACTESGGVLKVNGNKK